MLDREPGTPEWDWDSAGSRRFGREDGGAPRAAQDGEAAQRIAQAEARRAAQDPGRAPSRGRRFRRSAAAADGAAPPGAARDGLATAAPPAPAPAQPAIGVAEAPPPTRTGAPPTAQAAPSPPPSPRRKLKKLRLALVLVGLASLALISTVFGMMMAVTSDLPALEQTGPYQAGKNSVLRAATKGHPVIANLTGNENRILLPSTQISPNIKNAVIAIEDRRFYEHHGVDYQGIARAFIQDVLRRKASQGGSTITQQFVKNALQAQSHRSVFEKLKEAALAYHLERKWDKQKIITHYLNTVYFGNGAYGVESAARTYFGGNASPAGPESAASNVTPAQAALLAGLIASPSGYDPVQHPLVAKQRRDLVLDRMLGAGAINRQQYDEAVRQALPAASDVHSPQPDSKQPYFSSWVTQQLVDRYGAIKVFGGGLQVTTTLDPELQDAARQAIDQNLAGVGPSASLVAIENKTGKVRALVGGESFKNKPFNLATNGHRQPGSAIKPFILVEALRHGISPNDTFASRQKVFRVPGGGGEQFVVNNYEDRYSGVLTLADATAQSDNSVFAELGLKHLGGPRAGPRRIARLAEGMGIRTHLSTNPAMVLGGLKEGVTPLEMAYAYSTIANRGGRASGSLAPGQSGKRCYGPVALEKVVDPGSDESRSDAPCTKRVFSKGVGDQTRDLLHGVITKGTGRSAQIADFAGGKTGTTENYGDAWFVGFTDELTVAVWVGYPDKLRSMKTEYRGGPVAGGTFPADIWRDFMSSAIDIRNLRSAVAGVETAPDTGPQLEAPQDVTPAPTESAPPEAPQQAQPEQQKESAVPRRSRSTPAPRRPAAPPRRRTSPGPGTTLPGGPGGGVGPPQGAPGRPGAGTP
jgi:penicillin-binding protein 1A